MTPRPRRNLSGVGGDALIDWREADRNAHVLDWRERAHEFGLVPVDEGEGADRDVVEPPERLLHEEEPEALDRQKIDQADREPLTADEIDEAPEAHVASEDLDLVRVYLKHIGGRKLLKAREEQEIGARIEQARGDLLAEVAAIPAGRRTLLTLADPWAPSFAACRSVRRR